MASLFEAVAGKAIGYTVGLGGAVTQETSKATTVVLNKPCGQITMHNAQLAAAAEVSFTVTCSEVAASDIVLVNHSSAGTGGAYLVQANTIAAGSFKITVSNVSADALSQAIVLTFVVFKASAS
jgi:hypothetical protein